MKKMTTSLRGRLIMISSLGICLGIIGCVLISKMTMEGIEQQQLEKTMRTKLAREIDHLEMCYLGMIRLIWQMGTEGATGQMMTAYLEADNNFDKYVCRKKLQSELVTIAFPNLYVNFLTYIDSETKEGFLGNLATDIDGFSCQNLINMFEIGGNKIQAMHYSDTKYGNAVVASVLCEKQRFGDRELDIYIEMKTGVMEYEYESKEGEQPFIFVQLNEQKQICFCNASMFETGQVLDIPLDGEGNFAGVFDEYFLIAQQSPMGFIYLIAVPQQQYREEYIIWYERIFVLCLISVIPAFFIMLVIWKMIGQPIHLLEKEIIGVSNGNLEMSSEDMHVDEFKELMHEINEMKKRIRELLKVVRQEEKLKQKIEREKLMYQINPHFVLNSLNSIQWMAAMAHQTDISSFVADLKALLAYNLGKERKISTIRSEIEIAKKYISLQKQRYDFEIVIDVEEGKYLETETIRMLLQPLIENAVRYGLGEKSKIELHVLYDPILRYAVILLQDYGKGLDTESLTELNEPFRYADHGGGENKGIGLRYVRNCLEGFYGGNAILTINSAPGKGTKITILIPVDPERG